MKKRLSSVEKEKIENRAAKVLAAFQYTDGEDIYVDSVRLARFFGFEVVQANSLSAAEDGSVRVSKDASEKYIEVNDARSFESKRFIIVHELAHYLLHYMGSGTLFMHRENKKGKSIEENDADYLAACLLMPPESFKAQYKLLKAGRTPDELVTALQDKFCTPRESIERRIDEVCHR